LSFQSKGCYAVLAAFFLASGSIAAAATLAGKLPKNSAASLPYSDSGPEPGLARIFAAIEQQKLDEALGLTDQLLRQYPNFRLGHLIRGDLLLARTRPILNIGNAPGAPADQLADLRAEAIARLKGYKEKPRADYVPRYLLQLEPDQKYAIVVDSKKSRLYVYQNEGGRPRFIADYYFTQGKEGVEKSKEGDKRTPIGVYHVTKSLPRKKLPDFYGSGAFPINYPNEWDIRNGKTGHGIWLHGTPSDTFSRPPKASDGCVVLANQDLDALAKTLQIGLTPVIISNDIEWLSLDDWQAERSALLKKIDEWRTDWESRDIERYLGHYSKQYESGGQKFGEFAAQKRQVNDSKKWIKVQLNNMSMFRSPGREEMAVVTFEQDYRSNNLSKTTKKRQYWIREGGQWKIVHESTA
jgi:murein L,D-transpeptidase YafK